MEALTYSTVAVTLGLVVARPRISTRLRLTPSMAALAGVAVLAAIGSVQFSDIAWGASTMWRPLLGVVAIMMMTGVARRVGVLDGLAELVFARARGARLYALVFAVSAVTSATLNNDSAILLLTPLVVGAAKTKTPKLVVPLAFAVFLAAGVAPFIVSNPMNMVVASYAGIGFNEYAVKMAIPALAGAVVTFLVSRFLFRRDLAPLAVEAVEPIDAHAHDAARPDGAPGRTPAALDRPRVLVLACLALVVLAYPVVSWFGGPVWIVAACGALVVSLVGWSLGHPPQKVAREEVHLDTLLFLFGALVLSIGLRHVGVVARLASIYDGASPWSVGAVSALGSAVLNNHPMSHLNMFALDDLHASHSHVLAALIGGDLGPRLFPMGSLAGLLWLEMLRREGITVPVKKFLWIGAAATVPTLALCLALVR